ncbi:MAG: lytic transglycosylase domain-containing protein, partial [Chloroflexota bacterium]
LSTQYGASDEAKDGLFNAALLLRTTAPTQAVDFFGKVETAEGFVWQGKLLAQAGDTAGATAAWQKGIAAEPGTYFSVRACELANNRSSINDAPLANVDTSGDKAAAEAWVAQTFNLPGVTADLSPELANDPMLKRGTELWSVGMWSDARAEFDALHKQRRADAAALLQLAFYYQSIPIYRSSLLAATRLSYLKDDLSILSVPKAILRLAFPIRYADLLVPLAQQNGLDPLLVAALVRQESSFDPTVVSVANARGLMQFVPATAQDMADQLAWPDYTLDDLYRPIVSISFGTHYLSAMRDYQDGSDVGALLSYNAGPGIAKQWLNNAGSDLEALYETIDYSESRSYLDLIYTNHFIYQQLYTDNPPTC